MVRWWNDKKKTRKVERKLIMINQFMLIIGSMTCAVVSLWWWKLSVISFKTGTNEYLVPLIAITIGIISLFFSILLFVFELADLGITLKEIRDKEA